MGECGRSERCAGWGTMGAWRRPRRSSATRSAPSGVPVSGWASWSTSRARRSCAALPPRPCRADSASRHARWAVGVLPRPPERSRRYGARMDVTGAPQELVCLGLPLLRHAPGAQGALAGGFCYAGAAGGIRAARAQGQAVRVRLSRAGEQAVFELPASAGPTFVYVQEDEQPMLSMLPHSEQEMEDQSLLRLPRFLLPSSPCSAAISSKRRLPAASCAPIQVAQVSASKFSRKPVRLSA